ncbi:hypothetical protein Q8A73_011148 [Channa argus]|nr:hypothetical protein Q8A73_011148 [Channa argus]
MRTRTLDAAFPTPDQAQAEASCCCCCLVIHVQRSKRHVLDGPFPSSGPHVVIPRVLLLGSRPIPAAALGSLGQRCRAKGSSATSFRPGLPLCRQAPGVDLHSPAVPLGGFTFSALDEDTFRFPELSLLQPEVFFHIQIKPNMRGECHMGCEKELLECLPINHSFSFDGADLQSQLSTTRNQTVQLHRVSVSASRLTLASTIVRTSSEKYSVNDVDQWGQIFKAKP